MSDAKEKSHAEKTEEQRAAMKIYKRGGIEGKREREKKFFSL